MKDEIYTYFSRYANKHIFEVVCVYYKRTVC